MAILNSLVQPATRLLFKTNLGLCGQRIERCPRHPARFHRVLVDDKKECEKQGILWLPVIYPGFSWDNLQKLAPGASLIPRRTTLSIKGSPG